MVDYRTSLVAVRSDPQWKRKMALGILIQLIPYVGLVWLIGWQMEYQRGVAWGDDRRLPEWSAFGRQAMLGLKAVVAVLPFSFALSLFTIPSSLAAVALLESGTDAGAGPGWVAVAAFIAGMVVLPIAITMLMVPLTSSVMLRVALYDSFESGFQYKEILRLMRERKKDLLRAWGFSAINAAISLGAMAGFFGLIWLVMVSLPGTWEQKIVSVLVLAVVAYLVYMAFALGLSVYLGLVNMHLFGSYGRAAYRLDEQRAAIANGLTNAST